MSDGTWQVSGTYLGALVEAMAARKTLAGVKALLGPEATRAVENAGAQRWWPGRCLAQVLDAHARLSGPEDLRATAVFASHSRMGPLARPLSSIVLLLAKEPLDALCSRVDSFVGLSLKGVTARWERTGPGQGMLTFDFPEAVPAHFAELWHGMMTLAFELAKTGQVHAVHVEPARHRFELRWS